MPAQYLKNLRLEKWLGTNGKPACRGSGGLTQEVFWFAYSPNWLKMSEMILKSCKTYFRKQKKKEIKNLKKKENIRGLSPM